MSALDRGALDAFSVSLASDALFAGVMLGGAGPVLFWKKPAMLCCFAPSFRVLELPGFFAELRCVPISFPSIPRAILRHTDKTI